MNHLIAEIQNETHQTQLRATFILDNRGKEDSIEQIIEGVKKDIAAVQGEVTPWTTSARRTSCA